MPITTIKYPNLRNIFSPQKFQEVTYGTSITIIGFKDDTKPVDSKPDPVPDGADTSNWPSKDWTPSDYGDVGT